jgi:DNA polymerase III delta prime subunit
MENVSYDMQGLEALIFTAEGDMRNALNGLQSTVSGFGHVSSVNVFKVRSQVIACDMCLLTILFVYVSAVHVRCVTSRIP